ncbi:hypothetical protein H9L41_05765 [Chitinimonas koreensis]|nr:hypothetical protein H9L41_05765 [Chitinimonas koreensis]
MDCAAGRPERGRARPLIAQRVVGLEEAGRHRHFHALDRQRRQFEREAQRAARQVEAHDGVDGQRPVGDLDARIFHRRVDRPVEDRSPAAVPQLAGRPMDRAAFDQPDLPVVEGQVAGWVAAVLQLVRVAGIEMPAGAGDELGRPGLGQPQGTDRGAEIQVEARFGRLRDVGPYQWSRYDRQFVRVRQPFDESVVGSERVVVGTGARAIDRGGPGDVARGGGIAALLLALHGLDGGIEHQCAVAQGYTHVLRAACFRQQQAATGQFQEIASLHRQPPAFCGMAHEPAGRMVPG